MDKLTLYVDSHWISPYAMTAFVALEEKGLAYEVREVSLARGEQRTYGARTGRVPALQHGDYWLAESLAIAEYLAETFPYPHAAPTMLFPADFRERGICREVMSWLRSDLAALREERPTHSIFYERATTPLSSAGEEAAARLVTACGRLIDPARTTLFEKWCIADPDLALMIQRLHLNGHPLPPEMVAYAEANWQHPAVQKWCAHPRPAYEAY